MQQLQNNPNTALAKERKGCPALQRLRFVLQASWNYATDFDEDRCNQETQSPVHQKGGGTSSGRGSRDIPTKSNPTAESSLRRFAALNFIGTLVGVHARQLGFRWACCEGDGFPEGWSPCSSTTELVGLCQDDKERCFDRRAKHVVCKCRGRKRFWTSVPHAHSTYSLAISCGCRTSHTNEFAAQLFSAYWLPLYACRFSAHCRSGVSATCTFQPRWLTRCAKPVPATHFRRTTSTFIKLDEQPRHDFNAGPAQTAAHGR